MATGVEKKIDSLLKQGKTKKQVAEILSREMDREDYDRFLRNRTELSRREAYQGWNLLLLATLAAVTFYKLGRLVGTVTETGIDNLIITAWRFVVPAVNIYLLWLIHQFNRLGYMFVFILSALTLALRPDHHSLVGLIQMVPLILLSGFLYLKLFPKGGRDYP